MGANFRMIGLRIKNRRKQLGKTQDNLAEWLSVSVGYVSQIERGVTKVSLDTLTKISSFLCCDVAELVSDTPPTSNNGLEEKIHRVCREMNDQQKNIFLAIGNVIVKNEDTF